MVTIRRNHLKPIIDSFNGVHLSAYVVNKKNQSSINKKLNSIIAEAKKHLTPVMSRSEINKFLEPIIFLKNDDLLYSKMTGNFALFRTTHTFRILNIPIDVEEVCVIATTFHVKPLLRWIQNDRDFLFLGVENRSVILYHGNQNNIQKIDTLSFENNTRTHLTDIYFWLNEHLEYLKWDFKSHFFIAGDQLIAKFLMKKFDMKNNKSFHSIDFFSDKNFSNTLFEIRNTLKIETIKLQKLAILEFYYAQDLNIVEKDIFQIAKKSVNGSVKKLIIADQISLFGKIDRSTGNLVLHSKSLNHEDDDILDDLAQIVLANGGEVIVLPIEDIPDRRLVLAIVDASNTNSKLLVKKEDYSKFDFAEVV